MEELLSGDFERLMVLLRVAGASRALSAGLLGGIGDLLGIVEAGEAIASFDSMSDDDVRSARSWLVTAPGYRSAIERLGEQAWLASRPSRGRCSAVSIVPAAWSPPIRPLDCFSAKQARRSANHWPCRRWPR